MTERNRRRLHDFAIVCGGFAFACALTVIVLGERTLFNWLLLGGTASSVLLNLQTRPKLSRGTA